MNEYHLYNIPIDLCLFYIYIIYIIFLYANFSEITLISIGVVIRDRTAGNTPGIVCPHIRSHTCTNAHTHAHMQTHIHKHMHTYKHTYTWPYAKMAREGLVFPVLG